MLSADFTTLVIVFVSILLSMSLHEAMHAFTGHWLGDTTASDQGRLTLNPLKHIDIFTTVLLPLVLILLGLMPFFAAKPVPFNPSRVRHGEFGAALVGLAGPLTNLLLAILTAGILRTIGGGLDPSWLNILQIFLLVNIGFFVFNMIPFPPLDGSRLLYAFAPEPLQNAMMRIEYMGFSAILLFMFVLFPILSPIIQSVDQSIIKLLLG